MRIFALSDIHIDYDENLKFINNLSTKDYQNDILIIAGDITNNINLLLQTLEKLKSCFHDIVFVFGNHDLWSSKEERNSLEKFLNLYKSLDEINIKVKPVTYDNITIIPLMAWYDYSFGKPSDMILTIWSDFFRCTWPDNYDENRITDYFIFQNEEHIKKYSMEKNKSNQCITFSHFLPRIDLMPSFIPTSKRILYPVLGTVKLEKQIRELNPIIHIYGHSHLNIRKRIDNIDYINNAYGYPNETNITQKKLMLVHEVKTLL